MHIEYKHIPSNQNWHLYSLAPFDHDKNNAFIIASKWDTHYAHSLKYLDLDGWDKSKTRDLVDQMGFQMKVMVFSLFIMNTCGGL